MEHFIRIAFWIVTLTGCVLARSLPLEDSNIDWMQKHVVCPSDSRFYDATNLRDNCTTTALGCFLKELHGAVRDECDDPEKLIDGAVEFLSIQIEESEKNGRAISNSTECACENGTEVPFDKFLDKMLSLVQRENEANSKKKERVCVQ